MVKPDSSVVLIDFNQAYIWGFTIRWGKHTKQQAPDLHPVLLAAVVWVFRQRGRQRALGGLDS
jgi:hypothetical protein